MLTGVVVSVGFGDFLRYTLPRNAQYFDSLIVVTHPEDQLTLSVCRDFPNVHCMATECMNDEGAPFNKGRAINRALDRVAPGRWVVHLDADIVLPAGFDRIRTKLSLDPAKIYGVDRFNVFGFENFVKHIEAQSPPSFDGWVLEPPPGLVLGARFIHDQHGYVPIGYFQMWQSHREKRYPETSQTAGESDCGFASLWRRSDRILLPEFFVFHLESEDGPVSLGTNWRGRRTKAFGPG